MKFNLLRSRFWAEIYGSKTDSLLYPTDERIRLYGIALAVMMAIAGVAEWSLGYTNMHVPLAVTRALCVVLDIIMVLHTYKPIIPRVSPIQLFSIVMWLHMPLLSWGLYFMFPRSAPFIAGICLSLIAYFYLQDWRAVLVAWSSALVVMLGFLFLVGIPVTPPPLEHLVLFAAALGLGMVYSLSMGTLRGQRLRQALSLVGQVNHVMQPHLQSLAELPMAISNLAQQVPKPASRKRLEGMSNRLAANLLGIHRYLKTQRSNARLSALGEKPSLLSAHELVKLVLGHYPFESSRQRNCVKIQLVKDFYFTGNPKEWHQALENMISNALMALSEYKLHLESGDLTIAIEGRSEWGRISLRDAAMGIESDRLLHIFEPFYGNEDSFGVGLGLAYAQRVAQLAGGHIQVASALNRGTVFHIYIPVAQPILQEGVSPV